MAIEGLKDVLRSESTHGTKVDVISTVEEYVNQTDWRVNANSNSGGAATHPALINTSAGKIIANYWLDKVYSKAEGDAHRNGDYHIHDLDNLSGYCFTKDTKIKTVEYGDIAIEDLLAKGVDEFTVYSTDIAGEKVYLNYDLNLVDDARTRRYYGEDLSVAVKLHNLGGHFKTCKARNLRKTRENAEIVEVVFGGSHSGKVHCTPDHKFLVSELRMNNITFEPYLKFVWVEARNLMPTAFTNSGGFDGKPYSNLIDVVRYDGSTAWVKSVRVLEKREDVYCMEVEDTHCFALENGTIAHNCCGHDLAKLLNEGFNGVVGRVGSKAPKHVREALNQMANYIGILQAEWAGAQAFSSFDTYLAPLVFFDSYYDGMTYDDLKKAVRNFVYNLNVPSRWGQCVPNSYKALRADGKWVSYDELKVGDEIYVVDMENGSLKKDSITHLNIFDAPSVMHKYSDKNGFNFQITPNHRVIYKTVSNEYRIEESSKLFGQTVNIPVSSWNKETIDTFCGNEYAISDEMLELIAFIMVDGRLVQQEGEKPIVEVCESALRLGYERFEEICETLKIHLTKDKQNGVCCYRINDSSVVDEVISLIDNVHTTPKWFSALSPRQVYKFLDTWVLLNGHFDGSQWELRAAGGDIQEMLAYLTIKAGKGAALMSSVADDNGQKTRYSTIYKRGCRSCEITEASPITDKVWCPTTNTGTFICMTDEGYIFLTGNSPFSNVTIDLKCPKDLRERTPMRDNLPFFVSVYNDLKESIDKGKELYEKHGEKTIAELSKIPEDEKHLMQIYDGWQRLMAEAQSRLNDYESDDETLCYSLTYNCFQKEMEDVMRAYYEVMSEGDAFGLPFTFPIPTVNITEDFDWDNPRYDILWDNTAKYGCSYFQNFCGSQYLRDENGELTIRNENAYSPDDVRSMAFLGTQDIIYRDKYGRVSKNELRHLVHNWMKNPEDNQYEFLIDGNFHRISDMFEIDYSNYATYNKITLDNGYTFKVSKDHKCAVLNNDGKLEERLSQDVKSGDKFVISAKPWGVDNGIGNETSGRIIGFYLAEGWCDTNRVMFAINIEREDIVKEITRFFEVAGVEVRVEKQDSHKIYRICVFSRAAVEYVHHFVKAGKATEKGLTTFTWNTSDEFRKGIYEGYYDTDGSKNNKCFAHTTNKELCEDLIILASSIGKALSYSVNENNTRYFKKDKSDLTYFTSYKLKEKAFEKSELGYVVKVSSNEELPSRAKFVYNFTIDTPEHLVELPNGIISPQCCRLQLDKREVKKRGGGLFGSDSQTGCYDDKTEVMTTKGWKFFKDLTLDDEFYTLNDKRDIEVHKANQLFVYDWDGEMCCFKNKSVDLLVTPNHNMLLTHNSNDKLRFKHAEDCNHSFTMPLVGKWNAPDVDYHVIRASEQVRNNTKSYQSVKVKMDTWLKFLGLFLSEGSVRGSKGGDVKSQFRYEVAIIQKKQHNIALIDEVMNEMPFTVNRRTLNDGTVQWVFGSKQLWEELSPLGCSWNKYIPEYVFNCSTRQLHLLYDYMMLGDGHNRKTHKQSIYYTSSKKMADDFQHLLLLIGRGSSLKKDERIRRSPSKIRGREIVRKHDQYEVGALYSRNRTVVNGYTKEHYTGKVYCVEVPNHTLYVRRNGKCVWCGNSIGVVTINLARIGYLFKGDEKGFMKRLFKLMDYAKNTLEKKRKFIKEMVLRGLYPYTRRYITSAKDGFTTFFSTIGINGMNEAIRNFTNDEHDITDKEGQEFALRVTTAIRERLTKYQEETGNIYNLEASPAEGCISFGINVLGESGYSKIGELAKKGNTKLLSYNRKTGETELKQANVFFDSISNKHYVIMFNDGLVIECTAEHPFAVVKDDDFYWSPASSLISGDVIKGLIKNKTIVSIGVVEEEMPVYNATVEDNENFYMGDEEHGYILTHNTTYRFAKEDAKRYGSREVHYIICDKHGKVEVEVGDEETEIECPLCKAEEADDNSTKEK